MITTESRSSNAYWNLKQGWGSPWTTYDGNVISRLETITGYRGPRLADAMHDVNHTKMVVARVGAHIHSYDGQSLFGTWPVGCVGGPYYTVRSTLGLDFPKSESDALTRQMLGSIEPSVSVPNMLLELPQTLSLWRSLKDPLLRAVDLARSSSVRSRVRHGSNALLAQQFGLAPLIGDLTKLLTSTKSIHSEVARIQRIPRLKWEPTTKRLAPRSVNVAWFVDGPWSLGAPSIEATGADVKASVHYEQRRTMVIADPGQLATKVAQDLYGFNSPASVLWEATPFSFVGDWFFPIGDYLKALDKSQLANSLQIRRVCTCVKAQATADVYMTWQYSTRTVVATAMSSIFQRFIGLPNMTSSLSQLEMPDLRQATLAGALCFQR